MCKGINMKKLIATVLGLLAVASANAEYVPDYSAIDSREKALELVQKGELVETHLFPAELGGQDVPQNKVFVPVGVPEIQTQITGTIVRFAQDGLIDNMQVDPEYKGESFVPSKIKISTSHSGKDGKFNPVIEIW